MFSNLTPKNVAMPQIPPRTVNHQGLNIRSGFSTYRYA